MCADRGFYRESNMITNEAIRAMVVASSVSRAAASAASPAPSGHTVLTTGQIIAIAVGVLVFIVLKTWCMVAFFRHRLRKRTKETDEAQQALLLLKAEAEEAKSMNRGSSDGSAYDYDFSKKMALGDGLDSAIRVQLQVRRHVVL